MSRKKHFTHKTCSQSDHNFVVNFCHFILNCFKNKQVPSLMNDRHKNPSCNKYDNSVAHAMAYISYKKQTVKKERQSNPFRTQILFLRCKGNILQSLCHCSSHNKYIDQTHEAKVSPLRFQRVPPAILPISFSVARKTITSLVDG